MYFPQKVKACFRPGCRWDASLNLVAGLFADAPCVSSLYLDAISHYYWWRHFWEASRVPLWFNKSALFLVALGNTSDLKTAGEPSSAPQVVCVFQKHYFFSNYLNIFRQGRNCSLLRNLWPASRWCSKSEKFIPSITPSSHLICRRFPFYFVLYFCRFSGQRYWWGSAREGSPEDGDLNPCQLILDLQCSLQNAKDRSEQGRKLSPALLLISGWKRYFYRQGKIKMGTGKGLKALQCLHDICFFTWKFFCYCRNLLDKKGKHQVTREWSAVN